MQDREKLTARYGFNSFAELLDISEPLPILPGDKAKSYVARSPLGYWFVWEDVYLPAEAQERGNPPAGKVARSPITRPPSCCHVAGGEARVGMVASTGRQRQKPLGGQIQGVVGVHSGMDATGIKLYRLFRLSGSGKMCGASDSAFFLP